MMMDSMQIVNGVDCVPCNESLSIVNRKLASEKLVETRTSPMIWPSSRALVIDSCDWNEPRGMMTENTLVVFTTTGKEKLKTVEGGV